MEATKEAALIEAVLLLESDPVEVRKLSLITGFSLEVVQEAITQLQSALEADGHGLEIVEIGGGFYTSFTKRPAHAQRSLTWMVLTPRV